MLIDSEKPVQVVLKSKKGETMASYFDGRMQVSDGMDSKEESRDDLSLIL